MPIGMIIYLREGIDLEIVRVLEDEGQQALSFEAIAPQVGFASYSTFYNSFKNIMGITPMEMRNMLKGGVHES